VFCHGDTKLLDCSIRLDIQNFRASCKNWQDSQQLFIQIPGISESSNIRNQSTFVKYFEKRVNSLDVCCRACAGLRGGGGGGGGGGGLAGRTGQVV